MARLASIFLISVLVISLVEVTVSSDPPEISPAPAPEIGSDSPSPGSSPPVSGSPSNEPEIPSPSPEYGSPPAPTPANPGRGSSAVNSPSNSPAPEPSDIGDLSHESSNINGGEEESIGSSKGLNGGQKVGIVIGVILGACIVCFGALVYKRRRDNIRRSQYGYAARREIL